MRLPRICSALSVAALLLAACTPVPGSEEPGPAQSPSEDPTPEPTSAPPLLPEWPRIATTSAAGIPGLDAFTITDHDAQIHVVVPQIEGHEKFNDHLTEWAEGLVEDFTADSAPKEGEEPGAHTWLSSTWSATAVSAELLGITLHTSWSPGASVGSETRVLWYEPEVGKLITWKDLIVPEAREVIAERAVDRLKESSEDIRTGDIDVEVLAALFDDDALAVGFGPHGRLIITFDAYSVLAGSYGMPAVAFSLGESSEWLTDLGRAARDATMEPDADAVPETPQIPTPEPVDCGIAECVALTFDDGPGGATTPELLEILAEEQVPATFFMLGSQAQSFPGIVAEVAAGGHEIASHTWNHANLPSLGESGAQEDLARTNRLLTELTGSEVTLLRPPYGATDEGVAAAAAAEGLSQVLWNIDTRDWDHHKPKRTIAAAAEAEPGAIILMHDIHPETIDAVPGVIEELRKKGFTFVTVSTLLGQTTPGQEYFSRTG